MTIQSFETMDYLKCTLLASTKTECIVVFVFVHLFVVVAVVAFVLVWLLCF